jgi:hypothetical protein
MIGLNLETLGLQMAHVEHVLIRACVNDPDGRHSIVIYQPHLTMDEVVNLRRVVLLRLEDFRPRIEVTDALARNGLYDVRVHLTAHLDRIATPRLLQRFSAEFAAELARRFDMEIVDTQQAARPRRRRILQDAADVPVTSSGQPVKGFEPPTTACAWCPGVFPAANAYRSTKDGALICPVCFEKARQGGRAHLVEGSPGEEQSYGNLLAKLGR